MHERRGAVTEVLPTMQGLNENRRAGWMRGHFELAKLDRPRLTEETATTMQINFRSWRDTGITWLALAGVDVAKMQRRAGHDSISTTLGYVKMAEDLTDRPGNRSPRCLPRSSRRPKGSPDGAADGPARNGQNAPFVQPTFGPSRKKCQELAREWSGRRDLNPRRRAPKARALPDCATPRGGPRRLASRRARAYRVHLPVRRSRARPQRRLGHEPQRLVRAAKRRGAVAEVGGPLRIARDHRRGAGGDEPRQRTDLAESR